MKTLLAAALALGLCSTAARAQDMNYSACMNGAQTCDFDRLTAQQQQAVCASPNVTRNLQLRCRAIIRR